MRGARFLVLAAGLLASACHSSTTPSTPAAATTTATTPTPVSLAVDGEYVLTGLRQRSQVTAVATLDDGTTQDVTKTTVWASSNTAVAVVTSSGVVTTIAPGATHLTGTYQVQTDGFTLAVAPVTTTFEGTLASSDGRNGTFSIVVGGSVSPTSLATTAVVSGAVQIPGRTVNVTGFFQAATGTLSCSGVEVAYVFSGSVVNGVLTGSFSAPGGVSGTISSTKMTQG